MIRCPYCLNETRPKLERKGSTSVYTCLIPECKAEIPRDFVEKRKIPRATIGLVGFSGHGKTVYITSLFYLLKFLRREWEDYYFLSLDDNTHKIVHEHIPLFEESQLPESTPANFPFPSLIRFHSIPYYGDWFLSIYDTAGEVFEETQMITEQGRFVAHAEIALFIISVGDFGENWPDRMEALLDKYIKAVYDRMRVNLKKRQRLIVVLTKADSLIETDSSKTISGDLRDLLNDGSYKRYLEFESGKGIKKKLKENSRLIKDWLSQKGCNGFINMAKDNFKSVEYTICSSTGASPVGNRLATKLIPEDPKRVLDPFFWILNESRRTIWERLFAWKQ